VGSEAVAAIKRLTMQETLDSTLAAATDRQTSEF
jgi:hypothetical protein